MKFYINGNASWLAQADLSIVVPFEQFASVNRFRKARGPWMLGPPPAEFPFLHFVDVVDRVSDRVGHLEGVVPPYDLEDPQTSSVTNFVRARELLPNVRLIPAIHALSVDNLEKVLRLYDGYDVPLEGQLVALGIWPRAGRWEPQHLIKTLRRLANVEVHAFNQTVKQLRARHDLLYSADSRAWDKPGRRGPQLATCTHKNCGNCLDWAIVWRRSLLDEFEGSQMALFDPVKEHDE